jgi:hypothetical protein
MTLSRKVTLDTATQTPSNINMEQLINTNGMYRIKMLELQEIMALLVHFAAFLLNMQHHSHKKIGYYRRIAAGKSRRIEGKGVSKFKKTAIGVFFIELLRRKARNVSHAKEMSRGKQLGLELALTKCLNLREHYTRKNPVLEALMKHKAKLSAEDTTATFTALIG